MPPQSAYPSAALRSTGPRVSEVMGGKRTGRQEMGKEEQGREEEEKER